MAKKLDSTARRVERRLGAVEREMVAQLAQILASPKGFGGPESLFWDRRVIERNTLRWVLGLKRKAFCAGDAMAGW